MIKPNNTTKAFKKSYYLGLMGKDQEVFWDDLSYNKVERSAVTRGYEAGSSRAT